MNSESSEEKEKIIIQLMTTSGCHLCDEALHMFNYLANTVSAIKLTFEIQLVEIANDQRMIEDYGTRIPVLKVANRELNWIFTIEELNTWLTETGLG